MITPITCLALATIFNLAALADSSGAAATVQFVTPLVNIGVAGIMLWWFMSQVMPALKAIKEEQYKTNLENQEKMNRMNLANQEAIDRMARISLMLVVSSGLKPFQGPADALTAELDRAEDDRRRQREENSKL